MHHDYTGLIGLKIDSKYVLSRLLAGENGAAVFEAEHEEGSVPALIHLVETGTPQAEAKQQAWSLASEMEHPNLVRVLDQGHAEMDGTGFLYCATEKPEDSVADALPGRSLTSEEAQHVLDAIVPALRHLHDHGVIHGDVRPASIVAVGDRVKLTSQSLRRVEGERAPAFAAETRQLGATLVEMLTQKRPPVGSARPESSLLREIPKPLKDIASRTLDPDPARQWSIADVQLSLAGLPVPEPVASDPEFTEPEPASRGLMIPVLVAIGVLVLIGLFFFSRPVGKEPVATATVETPAAVAPTPAPVVRPSTVPPSDPKPAPIARSHTSPWAVVAAIYNSHEAASRRARELGKRWSKSQVEVFPEAGEGKQYMVILGSGMTKSAADKLRRQARAAGLPRDTYVTKLK